MAQVDVTATAGTATASYTTLSSAFAAINAGTHQGAITVSIVASTTESTTTCLLNASGAGSASYTSVLVQAGADGVTVSGAPTSLNLVCLNGADNVTIDGDNPGTPGTNRNLTFQNTLAAGTTNTSVIRLCSTSTPGSGADNNTIANCNLTGNGTNGTGTTSAVNTTFGVYAGSSHTNATTAPASGTTVGGTGGSYNNLIIRNNSITTVARGISLSSVSTGSTGVQVLNNVIGSTTPANYITVLGITSSNNTGALISDNTVFNISCPIASGVVRGIDVGLNGSTLGGAIITRNIIRNIQSIHTGTWSSRGIMITGGNNHVITNNMISEVGQIAGGSGAFSNDFSAWGIEINSGTGHQVYYNTVNMSGTIATAGGTIAGSAGCFGILSTSYTGIDVRNNIFSMQATGGPTNMARYCIFLPSGGGTSMNLMMNNNVCFQGTGNNLAQVGTTFGTGVYTAANFNAGATTPASNFRAYTSMLNGLGTNDNASVASTNAAPFTSTTDLHINMALPGVLDVNSKATPLGSVTADIDSDVRDAATPDAGADEFILTPCVSADGGIITPATASICPGFTYTMTATGTTAAGSITYQWEVSSTGGGAGFASVTGGTGATTTAYTTSALAPGTYYFRLNVTCVPASLTAYSNEFVLTVNPSPVITVTPAASSICQPGATAVTLTASGGVSYTWSPTTGLTPTTGSPVAALPTATTTYTATGTDANGCTGTGTATVTVNTSAILGTVTATPANACPGGNSQLNANAGARARNYVFSTSTGVALDPMTGATSVIGTGEDDEPVSAINIGFTFNYDGTNYTQVALSPDGWMMFGGGTAADQYSNAVTSTTNVPKLYPYWDDIATGSSGSIKTLVTGTAPNRIFIAQWNVTIPRAVSGAANSTFQAWLYEADNSIEFRYGTMGTGTMSASVGLTGTTPATNFNSITVSSNTNSTSTANDGNSGQPASGRMYRFAVPAHTYTWTPSTFITGQESLSNPVATAVNASVTYTVNVSNGACSVNGTVSITAGDTENPLITCPAPVSANADAGLCTASGVTLGTPVTSDNCTVTSVTNDAPATFPVGVTSVVWTVTDASGNTATCTQTVTVTDNQLPTITCPANVNATADAGTCTASGVVLGTPVTADNCGITSTTNDAPAVFPIGATVVTWTTTDVNGNTATCTQTVTVTDAEAPVISGCPSTVTLATNNAGCTAIVTWTEPTATDNCGTPVIASSHNSGDVFPVGTTTVTYTANDGNGNTSTCTFDVVVTNDLSAFATATDVLCNGNTNGSISLTVTGGDATYTFDWDNDGTGDDDDTEDLSALTPGTYNVAVTDANGCTATAGASVAEPAVLDVVLTASANPSACGVNDGTIDITVTGGTPGYHYSWNNGANSQDLAGLAPGTYTVTVTDDNGCGAAALDVTLADGLVPVVVVNSTTNASCNGGNDGAIDISVTLQGTATSYTASWDSGQSTDDISGIEAGVYTVTITDNNNCSASATSTVTEPAAISGAQNVTICAGESLTVGTSTYTTGGTYTDVLTAANGCDSTVTTVLTVKAPVNIATSTSSITITASSATGTFQWIDCNNGNLPVAGETSQAFTATANGSYAVIVTEDGCTDTSGCVNITTVGLENFAGLHFTVYPNPSNGMFTIETPVTGNYILENMLGEIVYKGQLLIGKNSIQATGLERGAYVLLITHPATGAVMMQQRMVIAR